MIIQPPLVRPRRVARCIAASSVVALLLGVAACSMSDEQESSRSASAEMQPESFTFAPPDGMRGVRTEHRRYEVSLVGAPLRNLEERELRWNIESRHTGDQFTVSQELAHVTIKHDGETVIDKDLAPGAVVAQLIVDKAGNLVDVRGLEGESKALQALAASDPGRATERALSPQTLKALVATRYQTIGDVVGRPTKAGTSWTAQGRPGGPILARTVTVDKMEPCGPMMCADLQAIYKLNPRMMLVGGQRHRGRLRALGRPITVEDERPVRDVLDAGNAPDRAGDDGQSQRFARRDGEGPLRGAEAPDGDRSPRQDRDLVRIHEARGRLAFAVPRVRGRAALSACILARCSRRAALCSARPSRPWPVWR